MSARHRWAAALALPLLLSAGCSSERVFTGYSLSLRGSSSPTASIDKEEGASVPLGGVLLFEARPRFQTEGVDFEPAVMSIGSDGGVADVQRTIEADTWMITTNERGTSSMTLRYEGREVDTISIEVF